MQNAAFQEGYKAFMIGKPADDNPYVSYSSMVVFEKEWDKGWIQAWTESELFS